MISRTGGWLWAQEVSLGQVMTGFCPLWSCSQQRQGDEDAPGKEWVPKG